MNVFYCTLIALHLGAPASTALVPPLRKTAGRAHARRMVGPVRRTNGDASVVMTSISVRAILRSSRALVLDGGFWACGRGVGGVVHWSLVNYPRRRSRTLATHPHADAGLEHAVRSLVALPVISREGATKALARGPIRGADIAGVWLRLWHSRLRLTLDPSARTLVRRAVRQQRPTAVERQPQPVGRWVSRSDIGRASATCHSHQ